MKPMAILDRDGSAEGADVPPAVAAAHLRDRSVTRLPLSTPERIATSITKGLLRREYVVGQRLVEAELTEKMGVSRSTVREALKILASRGVVEIIPHRGAVISGLTLRDAEDLLAVLEVLTGLAARLAAQKICEGGHRQRFAIAAQPLVQPAEGNGLDHFLDERARFYQAIFDIAGSEDLDRAMPTWRAHLFRNQFYGFLTRGDVRVMATEYANITDAILAGDGARAELHTRRHLQKTCERMLPFLR
jgi:DNA-binding GntR family transcriptional regulator